MNTRQALCLLWLIVLCLSGCATPREAHVESLMRNPSWPRVREIAVTEVKKRETLLGWPEMASYVPTEHKGRIWTVIAMAAPNDAQRAITLLIEDGGAVLAYQRHWERTP